MAGANGLADEIGIGVAHRFRVHRHEAVVIDLEHARHRRLAQTVAHALRLVDDNFICLRLSTGCDAVQTVPYRTV